MDAIRAGETVLLKAQFEPGAFPDEYIVTFSTSDGEVSGFVKKGNAVTSIGDKLFLTGQVQGFASGIATLFVRGSFFTNSGFVRVRPEQLEKVFA